MYNYIVMQKQKAHALCLALGVLGIIVVISIIITTLLKLNPVGTQLVFCFSYLDVPFLLKWVSQHRFTRHIRVLTIDTDL